MLGDPRPPRPRDPGSGLTHQAPRPPPPSGPPKVLEHGWLSVFEQAAPLAAGGTGALHKAVPGVSALAPKHLQPCGHASPDCLARVTQAVVRSLRHAAPQGQG